MQIYLVLVVIKNIQTDLNTRHCLHEILEKWFSCNVHSCTFLQVKENYNFLQKRAMTRIEVIWPVLTSQ